MEGCWVKMARRHSGGCSERGACVNEGIGAQEGK